VSVPDLRASASQPPPVTCPSCGDTYVFERDEDGDWWPGHAEWWMNDEHPFLCSRRCWLKAEGYQFGREAGRWVKERGTLGG
jgi:hypothetical protein